MSKPPLTMPGYACKVISITTEFKGDLREAILEDKEGQRTVFKIQDGPWRHVATGEIDELAEGIMAAYAYAEIKEKKRQVDLEYYKAMKSELNARRIAGNDDYYGWYPL